jgi:hypothetical protein
MKLNVVVPRRAMVSAMVSVLVMAGCATASPTPSPPPVESVPAPDAHEAPARHRARAYHNARMNYATATETAHYLMGASSAAGADLDDEYKVTASVPLPEGFVGHLAYQPSRDRLWLISYGPPAATRRPCSFFELERRTGRVLVEKPLPFQGEFGAPAFLDGFLYQGIYHQRKIYKIAVDGPKAGEVVDTATVPPLAALDLSAHKDKTFRFPFFMFSALAVTPGPRFVTHSEDLGELVTLEPRSAKVLQQVPTQPSLAGLAAVPGPGGRTLLLANASPREFAMRNYQRRFLFRGGAPPAPMTATGDPEENGVIWMLLDPASGEVLASTWRSPSRAAAGSVALLKIVPEDGKPYGRMTFLALGKEGLLTIEWAPSNFASSSIGTRDNPQ